MTQPCTDTEEARSVALQLNLSGSVLSDGHIARFVFKLVRFAENTDTGVQFTSF